MYQLGGLITGEATFGPWTVVAALLLAGIIWLLVRKGYQPQEHHSLSREAKAVKA